jgi:hypothetical protein
LRRGAAARGLLVVLAAALAVPAAAGPTLPTLPTLEVELDPREPTVGEPVDAVLTLRLDAEPAAPPRFPSWGERWGGAEVRHAGEPERVAGESFAYRQRLVLAAFRTGEIALPPQAVALPLAERTLQVSTPADLALTVRSVLPPDETASEPKPGAPLRPLPWGERFLWTAAALGALCLGAALVLLRRQSAATRAAAAPPLPPLAELEAALAALDPAAPAERLHTAISHHLRRYLGRALGFAGAESTTSEVQRVLLQRLQGELARHAARLLRDCDRVKFAREEASAALAVERARAAREIAVAVEEHLRPAPPAALEASA